MKLSELYWHRITPLHLLLWPISLLFGLYMAVRRLCYWLDVIPSVKLPVPVIVVDSITSDDAGKTPLTLWLVDMLHARGLRPAIVAHGNLDNPSRPEAVSFDSDPVSMGDMAVLLARRFSKSCPVWVGGDSVATAQALIKTHPECNIIICTSGLQNPRLERDFEIAVVDFNESSFGNGLLLPAGPLRANLKQLQKVDAVIINGTTAHHYDTTGWAPTFNMKLVGKTVYNIATPLERQPAEVLKNKKLLAACRYENAHWFLEQLQRTGLTGNLRSFDTEHRYVESDFVDLNADAIIMPEEEAVQCAGFKQPGLWALPLEVWINGELQARILNKIRAHFADTEILNELICPNCKCQLHHRKTENLLICDQDHLVFPIKDGIPDLRHGHKQAA